ncbi:MAG: V-type ATPase subunit [Thiohalocapsa sp.]|jgi:V/A-type H+-transporting ATPase subunit C|uniref:V-type ATPase subunit n=1 Tax=Thiohalocapsa sp. TaxID=2497641 RepID=UPI0025DACBC5|nr:V-type ATPase subunit [Thiohalocapsa sp.]MCG6940253.1 V-type ATPase subunit [Thiohalocapsa sp.]
MSAIAEAYLNTRISAMSVRLLDTPALTGLAELKLPALAERFGLEPLLDEQLPPRSRARAVEQTLLHLLLADLAILLRPLDATGRGLLLAWARKYALINLKTLIRGKLYGLDQTEIRENLFDLPARVRLPHQDLYRAENVLELLRVLEGGPFRLIARQARESYEQRRDPFVLEAAVDSRYYAELVRQANQLQGIDAQAVQHLLGAVLDRINLLWLLRFRFSFGFSPSEAFYHLVPSKRLLHRERLLELANVDGFEQLLEALPEPLNERLAGAGSLIEVQRRLGGLLHEECRRTLAGGRSGVARALAYLFLREHDTHQLYALIEGRLLKLPQEVVDIALGLAPPNCPMDLPTAA